MRGCLTALIAAMIGMGLLALFPLIREGVAVLNTTANISQYEAMKEAVDIAPLAILLVVGVLIVFAIFGIKIRPGGGRTDQ